MAVTKEAIVIVLDVGRSMHNEKDYPTVLEEAKKCINMIIERKIFSESKDEIGLILFGAEQSSNAANELVDQFGPEYVNITVVQDLQLASWELLEFVNVIQGTDISTDSIGDSALLTAIHLHQSTMNEKKFLSRRILFFSCFNDTFYSNNVTVICEDLKRLKIDLNVISPVALPVEDVKNGIYMQSYENDGLIQPKAEHYISQILKEVNGESYSFSDVLPALIYYQKKKVQAIPWNANLDIGTNLTIAISAYTKVTESKPKAWKNAYAFKLNAKIERSTSFLMNDELQTKVSKDGIIPAYKYGTTLVPYSEDDKKNMDYQSGEKGMKVLGFTKAENVQRYHYIGDKSMYVFGQKNRELAGVILAPFIQALHDTKMVAIVRYVYSQRSAPKIGFLSPRIKPDYECLVFVALPFMEDLRHFAFTPLDSDPKNIPTEEQLNAIDDLITSMDLTVPVDSEDEDESLKPKNTVNPYLQRLYQCLQFKAFHPEQPLPEIEPHIESLVNPSPKLLKRGETPLNRIKSLFHIKEIAPKKVSGKKMPFPNGKTDVPSGKHAINDFIVEEKFEIAEEKFEITEEKLGNVITDKIVKVGTINPVRDFQYLINNKVFPFNDVCQQMMDVVVKFLHDATDSRLYHTKILSICKEFRNASLKEGDCAKYNSFMTHLQTLLLECDEELWNKIRNEKIGLISEKEMASSTVSLDQAQMFLLNTGVSEYKDSLKDVEAYESEDDDYNNLLNEL